MSIVIIEPCGSASVLEDTDAICAKALTLAQRVEGVGIDFMLAVTLEAQQAKVRHWRGEALTEKRHAKALLDGDMESRRAANHSANTQWIHAQGKWEAYLDALDDTIGIAEAFLEQYGE